MRDRQATLRAFSTLTVVLCAAEAVLGEEVCVSRLRSTPAGAPPRRSGCRRPGRGGSGLVNRLGIVMRPGSSPVGAQTGNSLRPPPHPT